MWVSEATGTPQTHQIKFPVDSTQKHPRDIRRKEGTHDAMSTNRDKCGIVTQPTSLRWFITMTLCVKLIKNLRQTMFHHGIAVREVYDES